MKIQCAIFDFDGTLFDSMYLWERLGERYLQSLGKEPKPSLGEDIRALSLYQSACYFRNEYDLPLSAEEIMAGINKLIEDLYIHTIQPKPGVRAFLDGMKQRGISLCIATASHRRHIEAALRRCGMEDHFEAIFTCGEVGHGKDEPAIFRTAMEHSGADRTTTVIFEDALHGVQTAKADGFRVAAVFDPSEKRQGEVCRLADWYLEDFEHTEDFWKEVEI